MDKRGHCIAFGAIVELAKPVYIGRPEGKMAKLLFLLKAAANARKPALLEKAVATWMESRTWLRKQDWKFSKGLCNSFLREILKLK